MADYSIDERIQLHSVFRSPPVAFSAETNQNFKSIVMTNPVGKKMVNRQLGFNLNRTTPFTNSIRSSPYPSFSFWPVFTIVRSVSPFPIVISCPRDLWSASSHFLFGFFGMSLAKIGIFTASLHNGFRSNSKAKLCDSLSNCFRRTANFSSNLGDAFLGINIILKNPLWRSPRKLFRFASRWGIGLVRTFVGTELLSLSDGLKWPVANKTKFWFSRESPPFTKPLSIVLKLFSTFSRAVSLESIKRRKKLMAILANRKFWEVPYSGKSVQFYQI